MSRAARAAGDAALLVGGFVASMALGVAAPFIPLDEPWFLQVVRRVARGETLYRDVACGVTPLSVQVTSAFTRVLGMETLAIRALVALCVVLSAALAASIQRRLTGGRGLLLAGAVLATAAVTGRPPYGPLATLLLMATFRAALSPDERVRTLLAGALAGLCFATKQNVGLLALAAAFGCALAGGARSAADDDRHAPLGRAAARVFRIAAAFLLAGGLSLLPVALSGGLPALLDLGFLGKGAYVRLGRVPFADAFLAMMPVVTGTAGAVTRLAAALLASLYAAAPLALVALAAAWRFGSRERRVELARVLAFTLAGVLALYPRADAVHVCYAAPVLLTGLAFAWHEAKKALAPRLRPAVVAGAAAWIALWGFVRIAPPVADLRSGALRVSTLPFLRGILLPAGMEEEIRGDAARLAAARRAAGRELLLLSPRAGLFHLVGGFPNPGRFDYPWLTTFGRGGEAELQELIGSGRVLVFVDRHYHTAMSPEALERYAAARLAPRDAWEAGWLFGP